MTGDDWVVIIVLSLATLGAACIGVVTGFIIILGNEANDFRKERNRKAAVNKGEVNPQTED
jgi:hypothetical protein